VIGAFTDGQSRDLTAVAGFRSSLPGLITVTDRGRVEAGRDGLAIIKISVGTLEATVRVTAARTSAAPHSFRNEVIPALTRAGCNQGACHGSLQGKGGFRLSLLGFDPDADYQTIAKEGNRRRILLHAPTDSLLLRKATLGIPHAGGQRFKTDSWEYQAIAGWLADGAPGPNADEPEVAELLVGPAQSLHRLAVRVPQARAAGAGAPSMAAPQPEAVLLPGKTGEARRVELPPGARLIVTARFTDGHSEDVTRRAQFNSLLDAVAAVDDQGRVRIGARGQAAVMVRFRGKVAVASFEVPYGAPATRPGPLSSENFVDKHVAAKWERMGLRPSGVSSDAEFLRRVYLDLLGVLPTADEAADFLASRAPDRRARLVDSLLERPEYADYWTLKWGDLLRNNRAKLGEKGMWSFYNWLRQSFRANKPMDQFAKELVTAQGSTFTTGPANYFRVAGNPADQAENTSQVFLGIRLACAKCHHHPFEKWSQDDYWQMAAYFGRVGLKGSQEFGLFGGEQVVFLNPTAQVRNPRTNKVMEPTPLDAPRSVDPVDDRRALAAWLTDRSNSMFARSIVNRYWGYLMGRGIVEPVDDMRVTNPPSNPELLDALAADFSTNGFDVKRLLRTITNSAVYQLSSTPTRDNKIDEVFYTKYFVKRMGAETLLDALGAATGVPEKFPNLPASVRATQLPDPSVQSYFLDTFGRPDRQIACECERSAEPTMAQALHLMNSDFVENKLSSASGRTARLAATDRPIGEVVDELYLVTLSRYPTVKERQQAGEIVGKGASKKEGVEDLLWTLLNSREFLFVH
jgi:hypothetical protein